MTLDEKIDRDFVKQLKRQKSDRIISKRFKPHKRRTRLGISREVNVRVRPNGDRLFTCYYHKLVTKQAKRFTYDEATKTVTKTNWETYD